MLAKQFRLPIQNTFKRSGKTLRSSAFTLRVLPAERAESRFGIAVSRAAAPSAVARNKLKRIFFNTAQSAARTLPCRDYLVVANSQAKVLTKEQVAGELKELFKKISQFPNF